MTAEPRDDRVGPGRVLLWAAWFGAAGGAAELAAFVAKCLWLDPRNFNVSRHFPWMFPAAGLVLAAGPGALLALGAWARPGKLRAAWVLSAFAFPAYLGLLFRAPVATAACLVLAAGLALRTGSFLARRASGFDRLARLSLPVVAALMAAAGAEAARGHWRGVRGPDSESSRGRPNVLLLVLDTVRAQNLSLYGYGRETSPDLARYAKRGVRFDRAFSTAPWTAPSHASLFTGKWPHELSVGWGKPLDAGPETLAGFLASRGFDTAGFVANTTYCSDETGLGRGFARYEDYDLTPRAVLLCSALVQRYLAFAEKHPTLPCGGGGPLSGHRKSAGRIRGDFLSWLDARPTAPGSDAGPGRPFFAFLNFYDAHHPYLSPEPDDGRFGRPPTTAADFRTLRNWWGMDKRNLSEADRELARDAYDRCIAYLDGQVGRLLDDLDRRGALQDTLVIVTADHGEHLGEQGLYGHGTSLYRPELHVPLVVIPPGGLPGGGRVVREAVSLRDVPATVVDLLGLAAGTKSPFPGRSLAPEWSDDPGAVASREPAEAVRSEVLAPPEDDPNRGGSPARLGPMTSLVAWGHHYVLNGDGREELYDLDGDPEERHDLARSAEFAPTLSRFRTSLGRY